jgi:hypothetical protein
VILGSGAYCRPMHHKLYLYTCVAQSRLAHAAVREGIAQAPVPSRAVPLQSDDVRRLHAHQYSGSLDVSGKTVTWARHVVLLKKKKRWLVVQSGNFGSLPSSCKEGRSFPNRPLAYRPNVWSPPAGCTTALVLSFRHKNSHNSPSREPSVFDQVLGAL